MEGGHVRLAVTPDCSSALLLTGIVEEGSPRGGSVARVLLAAAAAILPTFAIEPSSRTAEQRSGDEVRPRVRELREDGAVGPRLRTSAGAGVCLDDLETGRPQLVAQDLRRPAVSGGDGVIEFL